METIGSTTFWSFLEGRETATKSSNSVVRADAGNFVSSFVELARRIAELQYRNRYHVLFFRGQNKDYPNRDGNSTLKPELFRPRKGTDINPSPETLGDRFGRLRDAERELVRLYPNRFKLGVTRLQRHRVLRWSILQHYRMCATPLLDVTHSLRIAASFASLGATHSAYVFAVGVPNLDGGVTASSEAGLQTIRLSSVCPPTAMRPHIQEGYLLGEYPEMADFEQKANYKHHEIDFGRRLVAKFRFNPGTFWEANSPFPQVSEAALFPNDDDPMFELAQEMERIIPRT